MALFGLFASPPLDYPNRLADPQPETVAVAWHPWLLLGLVALCAVPRAILAVRYASICSDGVLYVRLAQAISSGDLRGGMEPFSLNLYPVILAGLHWLGLPWELAGKLWGVLISSLVVLPLYGWIRRQFSESVAVTACLLYATHPTLIRWSPELMRDSTFWFLLVLAIYLMWRAVVELRWWLFVACVAVIVLSTLTRFEGLFLLVPLLLWSFWRWRALREGRWRVWAGLLASVLPLAVLLTIVKLVWFADHSLSAVFRLTPLELAGYWVEVFVCGRDVLPPPGIPRPEALSAARMLWAFFPIMTRGLSPCFALLMFGGLWRWRRVWSRRDHQPLFYVSLAVLGGIWIALWWLGEASPRYSSPIVLMASPFAALGLLGLTGWLARLAQRWECPAGLGLALAAAPLAVVIGLGLGGALLPSCAYRTTEVRLAEWVRREYGPQARLMAPVGMAWVIQYHGQIGPYMAFPWASNAADIAGAVRGFHPDVLFYRPTKQLDEAGCLRLAEDLKSAGFERVDPARLPDGGQYVHVLARRPGKTAPE